MLSHLLNGLSAVGNVLDLPGSSVRDVLAGQNPFDQYLTPMSDTNRTTGRGLLRQYGMAGNDDTWGNWAGGMAAEMALDPTNLIGGGFLRKAFKGLSKTKKLNAGIDAANELSQQQRAMGFMPEEIVQNLHPSVLEAPGVPKRFYHGTDTVFDKFDPAKDSGENLYGKGFYHTDNPHVASSYTQKEGSHFVDGQQLQALAASKANLSGNRFFDRAMSYAARSNSPNPNLIKRDLIAAGIPESELGNVIQPVPQNVRMAYMDLRNPLIAEATNYPRSAIDAVSRAAGDQEALMIRSMFDDMPPKAQALLNRPTSFSGDNLYYAAGEKSNEVLPKAGFDGIVHKGGKIMGDVEHNVAVAFKPEQIYKPYIAKRLQDRKPLPTAHKTILRSMIAHNALARGGHQ